MAEEKTSGHRPVMLEEVIDALDIVPAGVYVDLTFGRGGHAAAILQRLGPEGRLLAVDKDPAAVDHARETLAADARFSVVQGSFVMLESLARAQGVHGKVNGILLDLGVSSPQLDDAGRGFSFQADGKLDMRMDPAGGISAAEWLATAALEEIAQVLGDLGEERHARRIARAIVAAREEAPIVSTAQLADIIARAQPSRERHKHPATRSFQAIRIHINHELEDLRGCLSQVPDTLATGGRLVVISFHSLEDRIVKRFMRDMSRGQELPRRLPVTGSAGPGRLRTRGKAVRASREECQGNPRARSAVLRVAEKLH